MCGSIAQLGEHLPYKQRVTGSSPVTPTIQFLLIYFYGLVVQLVRTLACHARGREFESLPGRHRIPFRAPGPGGNISGSGSVVERRLAKANVASSNLVFRSKWRHSQVVRQGPAKPLPPVQIWVAPPAAKAVPDIATYICELRYFFARKPYEAADAGIFIQKMKTFKELAKYVVIIPEIFQNNS